jgi:hypothetical protein
VQALVFALLAMTYITMAIAEHESGHDDNHAAEGHGPMEEAATPDTTAHAPSAS